MTTPRKDTPFQLVASDLDGTLLAPDHKLSAFSKQTLKDLHDKASLLSLQQVAIT